MAKTPFPVKTWLAASLVAWVFVSPAAASQRGDGCDIDLGWILSVAGEGSPDRRARQTVRWQGNLPQPSLNSRFADQRLIGRAEADLRVAGMPTAPRITGNAGLADGRYEHFVAGTVIENLSAAIAADDGDVMRLAFTGTGGATGIVAGTGTITVEPGGGIAIEATADLTNLTLLRRDDIVAAATGSIAYRGTPCRGRIAGRFETTSVDIRLADLLPPSVVEIEVVEIGSDEDAGSRADGGAPGSEWSVDLDLTIDMPSGVFIHGRGIESEWSGDLTVTGTLAKPQLRGVLSLVRGEISFVGRPFVLSEGTIVFERGKDLSPLINLAASHRDGDITALMNVTGSAAAPSVVLTSQPELPQEEILARIMFDKSVARLSPAQVLRLAAAVRALSRGETMSEDVFGLARTLLGVDILAEHRKRRQSGDGDRRLDGDRRRDEASGPKPLEIEIAPGISVAAEQNQDEGNKESSLGIIWKWDY